MSVWKKINYCYRCMNRDVHVSVRLDDRIYKYIMAVNGKDFSDKLENLVIKHAEMSGKCIT